VSVSGWHISLWIERADYGHAVTAVRQFQEQRLETGKMTVNWQREERQYIRTGDDLAHYATTRDS